MIVNIKTKCKVTQKEDFKISDTHCTIRQGLRKGERRSYLESPRGHLDYVLIVHADRDLVNQTNFHLIFFCPSFGRDRGGEREVMAVAH